MHSSFSTAVFGTLALLALPWGAAQATPNLQAPLTVAGVQIYPDSTRSNLYYFGPGELVLARDADDRPRARLLEVRYVGTRAADDQGESMAHGRLDLTVRMDGPAAEALATARAELSSAGRGVELRPLPIARVVSWLIFERIESAAGGQTTGVEEPVGLGEGYFGQADAGEGVGEAYWRERSYSLRLEPADAQLLWDSAHAGRLMLSMGYVFLARGRVETVTEPVLSGHPDLVAAVKDALAAGRGSTAAQPDELVPVGGGATALEFDLTRWPELAARFDLNERLPPDYPLLDVYCYDFRDGIGDGIEVRRVELRAEGPGGGDVDVAVEFERTHPDLYAHAVRFPFAARLDRPYRFRVTDLLADGSTSRTDWIERASWSRILDVTTITNAEGQSLSPEGQHASPIDD